MGTGQAFAPRVRAIGDGLSPRGGVPSGMTASDMVTALWTWASGTAGASATVAPRLVFRGGRATFSGRHAGRPFSVDAVVAGACPADSDVVIPTLGAAIELRPYRHHADLTVVQPTVLTLATARDWEALAEDAAAGRPLGSCLLGVAAMHLFSPDHCPPECVRHHLLYRLGPVTAEIRRYVCGLEDARRRALAGLRVAATNREWT